MSTNASTIPVSESPSPRFVVPFDEMEMGPWGYAKRLRFIESTLRRELPGRSPESVRILDVGCGNGTLVALPLAHAGYDVTGIDLHPPSIDRARQLATQCAKAKFLDCPVESLSEPPFDVIILSEVLEHVTDPAGLLKASSRHLRNDGFLIVTVPNGFGESEIDARVFHGLHLRRPFDFVSTVLRKIVYPGRGARDRRVDATDNHQSGHVQFFRRKRLHRIFHECSLAMVSESAGGFICGPVITYTFARSRKFVEWNLKFADRLPLSLVSTWYFVLRRARPTV